jgi:hypothetical protein
MANSGKPIAARCYAENLGGCGGGISLEHISTKRIFKDAKMVETFGMGAPDGKRISLNSVGANILCRYHNSLLDSLDNAVGELADACGEFWRSGGMHSISINGTLIERWMLKYIFGASAAGYIGGKKMYPDEHAVRQLFGLDPLMDQFALSGVALPS